MIGLVAILIGLAVLGNDRVDSDTDRVGRVCCAL
jgi:hypothetical protein